MIDPNRCPDFHFGKAFAGFAISRALVPTKTFESSSNDEKAGEGVLLSSLLVWKKILDDPVGLPREPHRRECDSRRPIERTVYGTLICICSAAHSSVLGS